MLCNVTFDLQMVQMQAMLQPERIAAPGARQGLNCQTLALQACAMSHGLEFNSCCQHSNLYALSPDYTWFMERSNNSDCANCSPRLNAT